MAGNGERRITALPRFVDAMAAGAPNCRQSVAGAAGIKMRVELEKTRIGRPLGDLRRPRLMQDGRKDIRSQCRGRVRQSV